jgi:ABC-type multidrug transport system fused ATPase/permease subunit
MIVIFLIMLGYELGTIAPLVGVYLVAGFRLFPAFQKVYHGISGLRGDAPVVHALHAALTDANSHSNHFIEIFNYEQRLRFRGEIEVRNVTFTYPGAERAAVKGINFVIPCGSSVAFVGETGAGKTTLVDLIIGLLTPEEGAIAIDGVLLNADNLSRWRANMGYVPQHIYLMDDTIARNIAFGIPDAKIDMVALERAARIANIHDFVVNELAQGYDTVVGERGIRLSGGQRQRLGIARALYHDPELLILDEATSALDNATEDAVQKAIEQAAQAKTLIIIAHRLSTVRNCDFVYVLKKGRIVAQGAYETLLDGNAQFRALALAKG